MAAKKKYKHQNDFNVVNALRKTLVNDILKTVEDLQEKADRKLGEISYMCTKEQNNGK